MLQQRVKQYWQYTLKNKPKRTQQITAVLIIILVAGIGTILIIGSHAASPYASTTADSGTLTGGAIKQSCSGSSDGDCVVFGGSGTGSGPTYYIDNNCSTDGDTCGNGTSSQHPWQLAPGMQGFCSSDATNDQDCSSFQYTPGDTFEFKGGVTWYNSDFPLLVAGNESPSVPGCSNICGTSSQNIVYEGDTNWYDGSGYTKPVFTASPSAGYPGQNLNQVPNPEGAPDTIESMLWMDNDNYITVNGIDFTNWTAVNIHQNGIDCSGIDLNNGGGSGDTYITLDNIGFTNWQVDYQSAQNTQDFCLAIDGNGGRQPSDDTLENSVVQGDPGLAYNWSVFNFSRVINSTVSDATGLVTPSPDVENNSAIIAGNRLYNCGYPEWPPGIATGNGHADNLQSGAGILPTGETDYIFNNLIYNDGGGITPVNGAGASGECETMLIGGEDGPGQYNGYVWNNVMYNLYGNAPAADADTRNFYFFNNTMSGGAGPDGVAGGGDCLHGGHGMDGTIVTFENNVCITTGTGLDEGANTNPGDDTLQGKTLTVSNNLLITPTQAAADGFTPPLDYPGDVGQLNVYAPSSDSYVSGGANLTSLCNSLPSFVGANNCINDTTYGGSRTPVDRPANGAWNIGAYQ